MRAALANANGRLVRAVQARLGLAGGIETAAGLLGQGVPCALPEGPPLLVIEDLHEEPWASLTFTGMRHRLELRLDGSPEAVGQAYEALSTWADEADPLPGGHFLAEVQVTETARQVGGFGRMLLGLRLDALTIEE